VQPGERLVLMTSGGGGRGPASARERARIADDIANDLITAAAAGRDYGQA
jgi:N-methylhydantoinase B/oxoprolinase/acetone carboxylase alpha subunit